MRTADPETGTVCPPLTPGQLQISGPTVFREYYNNPRATMESFTSDGWFITGDVAQIDEEGRLHLTGRDKDCVNLNGVKHPSVDVEHYIEDAKIDDVTKAFVFACPMRLHDSDTETYGVFYQHTIAVEDELNQHDISAIISTNRAIKNTATVFLSQSPHAVIPLPRKAFVKTALGKISRSMLANAYLQGHYQSLEDLFTKFQASLAPEDANPKSDVEQVVHDSITSIFGLDGPPLTRSASIFDIGASSIHIMQLKQRLQERLSIPDIPTIEMLRRPEIGQLSDYLTDLTATVANATQLLRKHNPLVCLDPNGSKPPLFLVHPGVGEVLVFINLARVLKDDRPLYAIRARGFDSGETTYSSFEEMVDAYTEAIETMHPDGPYFLAGYSFGGAVAFEIGKKLEAKGKPVSWVGILNLPPHIQFRMKELVWVEVMLNLCMFLALVTSAGFEDMKKDLLQAHPEIASADSEPSTSLDIVQWVFERCDQDRLAVLQITADELRQWVRVAYDISASGRTYEPRGAIMKALMTVFCAIPLPSMGTREEFKQNRLSVWKEFSQGRFEMVDVDGEHYTMLSEEHVLSFADKMRSAMARAELASRPLTNGVTHHLPKEVSPVSNGILPPSNDVAAPPKPLHAPKHNFDDIPIVDFALADTNPRAYFKQLKFALEDVGFAVFVNVPGFEDAFQKGLFSLASKLFAKPQDWKDALGTSNSYSLRGYFRADDIVGGHKV